MWRWVHISITSSLIEMCEHKTYKRYLYWQPGMYGPSLKRELRVSRCKQMA